MIRVLFFARLREELGQDELSFEPPAGAITVGALLTELRSRSPQWSSALGADNILCAVNQEQACHDDGVDDGDEVAFFPPVTGG